MVSASMFLNCDTRSEHAIASEIIDTSCVYEAKQLPDVYDLVAKVSEQSREHTVKQMEVTE